METSRPDEGKRLTASEQAARSPLLRALVQTYLRRAPDRLAGAPEHPAAERIG